MAQTIKLKRSSVSGNTPSTSDLELGEVAINTYDGKMFIKKNDGSDSIVEIGGGSGTVTEAFKTIAVSGQSSVVADSATDTLTLVAGSNMTITTNASGDTITFASSGGGGSQNLFSTFAVSGQNNVVADSTTDTLTFVAGSGIGITTDASADSITIANTNNSFSTVAVSGQSNVAADSITDTLTLVAGSGITLTTDASADSVTITNSATGANAFGNILVSGQSTVAADSTNDNLTLVAGSNMTITTNASNDTITFASSGGGGSQNVFSNIGVSGQGTIQADATTDTLTFEAGAGISLTTDTTNDKLTITATGASSNVANAASSIKEFKYDISSSTTTLTGSDANSNTLAYEAGAIQVFLNGILLDPATDYTASNGTSVVLTDAAVSGDDVQIVSFNRKIVTANVGIDTFTGNGSTTAYTLSSDPVNENNTRVHIDGVYQEKAAYSVSGTTLTFSAAPPNGSSIEVEVGFTQAEIGSTLDFADNAILRIGTGNDLQILHDGSNSIIKDTGTGDLQIAASTLEVKNSGINETMLKAIEDGAVELYFDNSKKLETVTGGVTITGTATATTFSGDLSGTINAATTGTTQSASDNSTKIATTAYVDTAVTNLVDSAPGTLNTLNELAAALGDDANFSTTITNSLATKVGLTATTGAANIPAGTTGQRPGSPAAGQFRYNSTLNQFEGYTSSWGAIGGGGTNTFTTNVFTGDGSTTAFTLSQAVSSVNDCIVHVGGIYQVPTDAYTVSGTTLTFTSAPANTRKIVVYSVKAGVSGNNLNVQTINGNGTDHTFTLNVNPINENNTIVHIDGVYQQKSSYTVSGTSLSFGSGNVPANGTVIEVATFTQTEINVPVNDTIDTVHIKDDAVTSAKLGGNLTTPGNLTVSGTLTATLATAAQTNITSVGTLTGLALTGNATITKEGPTLTLTDASSSRTLLNFVDDNNSVVRASGPLLLQSGGAVTALTLDASQNATFAKKITSTELTITGGTDAADVYINNTSPTLGFTDSNSFSDSNDIYIVRGGSTGHLQFQFYDNSATATTTTFTIDETGDATFAGTVDTGGDITVTKSSARVRAIESGGATTQIASGGATGYVGTYSNHKLQLLSNSTAAITIDTSQNIGIGQDTPEGKLHIEKGSSGATYTADGADQLILENNDSVAIDLRTPSGNSGVLLFSDNNARGRGVIQYAHSNDTMYFNTAGAAALNIGSNQHATFSAGATFGAVTVVDVGAPSSTDQTLGAFRSQPTREIGFVWDDSASTLGVATLTNHSLVFHTGGNSSEKMRIDTNGNVGIGVTPPAHSGLGDMLSVNTGNLIGVGTSGAYVGYNMYFNSGNWKYQIGGAASGLLTFANSGDFSLRQATTGSSAGDTISYSTNFAVQRSTGYLLAQGASQVRLVLGSTGNSANNTSNWIRGNSNEVDINTAGGAFNIEQNGTKKVSLDSSGRMNVTYQPSAYRQVSSNNTVNCNGQYHRLAFGTSRHEIGSVHSYVSGNSANGSQFVAPVDGRYFYSCIVRIDGFSGNYLYLDMKVDGAVRDRDLKSETGTYITRQVSGVYQLSQGDQMTFEIANSGDSSVTVDNNSYVSFHMVS